MIEISGNLEFTATESATRGFSTSAGGDKTTFLYENYTQMVQQSPGG